MATAKKIPAPHDLLKGEALNEWHKLTTAAVDSQVEINSLNKIFAELLCETWSDYLKASQELRERNFFYLNDGKLILSPCVRYVRDLLNDVMRDARDMGLKEYRPRKPRVSRAQILFFAPVYRQPKQAKKRTLKNAKRTEADTD